MKTILLSLALGALFFALSLRVVETRAQAVPRVVEVPPPLIPDPPADLIYLEAEEPIETHPVSRAGLKWTKKKPAVVVRRQDVEGYSFSRYQPLPLRAVPEPPVPPRID